MKKLSIICTLLSLALSFSCQTDNEINQQQFTIEAAQTWFIDYSKVNQETFGEKPTGRTVGNVPTSKIRKQLFWEKAKLKRFSNKDVLVIPLWYEEKFRFGTQTIRQLWIYKNEAKSFETRVVELLATREYMNSHKEIKYRDFTGSVTIHDWHNGFRSGYQMEGGKKVGNITGYAIGIKPTMSNSGRSDAYCGGYYNNRPYYEPLCGCIGVIVNWIPNDCSFQPVLSEPYNYSAWMDYNFGCEAFNNCTTPNDGWYYEPEQEPVFDYCANGQCIQNQLVTPCLVQTAEISFRPELASKYNDVIQEIFNKSDKVNLILKEDPQLAGNVTGSTPRPTYEGDILNVTIFLNPNVLAHSSQEFIASTIYHEAFHAILHFFDTENWFFEENTTPNEQHYMMFTSSLDRLALALMAIFPNLSLSESRQLMLKGVGSSGLPSTLVQKILNDNKITIDQLRNTSLRYSQTGASGVRCN